MSEGPCSEEGEAKVSVSQTSRITISTLQGQKTWISITHKNRPRELRSPSMETYRMNVKIRPSEVLIIDIYPRLAELVLF